MDEARKIDLGIIYKKNKKGSDSRDVNREDFIVEVFSWDGRTRELREIHDI